MSEEYNLDDFVAEMSQTIIHSIEVESIKPFLIMLEKEIKEQLINDGIINNPDIIDSKIILEKIKVKDLGDGFLEIEECELDNDDAATTSDDDSEYFPSPKSV
tara:strand:+ start:1628 stop:1936 length:309 start_codon:yes stop_codon:yes gene_type:complete